MTTPTEPARNDPAVPSEATRRVDSGAVWPTHRVAPRPAATLLLVRDAEGRGGPGPMFPPGPGEVDENLQVLMVRRSERADFVGGAHVFPGGGVDPGDDVAAMAGTPATGQGAQRVWNRDDAEASSLLGVDRGGLAYWVAALRECFEEAGVLLAYRADAGGASSARETGTDEEDPAARPRLLSFAWPEDRIRFERLRASVNAGELPFLEMCRRENLVLALDRVYYFAHWVTPEGAPRRYDTRFFVAEAPEGQAPRRDEHEIVDEVWIRPSDALRQHREGHIDLVLPTVRCLNALTRFSSAGQLVEAVRRAGMPDGRDERLSGAISASLPGEPRMVRDFHGRRVVLPGDAVDPSTGPGTAYGAPQGATPGARRP